MAQPKHIYEGLGLQGQSLVVFYRVETGTVHRFRNILVPLAALTDSTIMQAVEAARKDRNKPFCREETLPLWT